ncbi:MAG: TonB family protein [Sandaracinaceae bacterium]|nr:TonB family protein [Sandaracinaceae bacterium]
MSRTRPLLAAAAISSVVHLALTLALFTLPSPRAERASPSAPLDPFVALDAIESAGALGASTRGQLAHAAAEAVAGGSTSRQNLDALDPGQGGDASGARAGMRLMIQDDRILLFDSPLTNVAAAQLQRIRTANDRATLERRRATPSPRDEVFLASGDGVLRERRPLAALDPRAGARVAPEASLAGALPAEHVQARRALAGAARPKSAFGSSRELRGAARTAPGEPGPALSAEGARASARARSAFARPAIDQGPAATIAERSDARVRDDADAELLAASLSQSWVDASSRTSRREGPGRGGVDGAGAPGSGGGTREGGRASAWGPGGGPYAALDTNDGRYVRWVLETRRRVQDALQFPRERALAMDQGTTIYMLSVGRDGRLRGAPRLVRSSGFADLDRAALAAIRRATPFSPVPDDLAPSLAVVPIRLPVEFSNPMVR